LLEDASNWAAFAHHVGADVDDRQTSIGGRGAGPGVASAPVRRGDAGGAGACAEPIRRVRRFGRRRRGPITVIVSPATAGVLVRLLAPARRLDTRPLARAAMASGTVRRGPPAGRPAAAA